MAQIEAVRVDARAAYAAAQASSDRGNIAAASREVRYWSVRRATARVVPASADSSLVRFSATVTIVRDDGREHIFRIVGEDEADCATTIFSGSTKMTVRASVHATEGNRVVVFADTRIGLQCRHSSRVFAGG